ncbi:MAG TPA: outer membrane beta-barrel protein [Bdellovibrionales bacterium]|nr:outer membrane beta-barrel protein [Bdellovibrionales bacterium]
MKTFIRFFMVMAVIAAILPAQAARKKQRTKVSFTSTEAKSPKKRVRVGGSESIDVQSKRTKSAAAARRSYIANNSEEEDVVSGGTGDVTSEIQNEFASAEKTKSFRPAPAPIETSDESSYQTNYTRSSFRRSMVTVVPVLGMSSSESGTGFTGGLMAEIGRRDFTGEAGVVYMQEYFYGTERAYEGDFETRRDLYNGNLGYITVPLMGRWNFLQRSNWRLHAKAGAAPAFLMNSYYEYSQREVVEFDSGEEYTGSNSDGEGLNAFNVFGLAGAGVDFKLSSAFDMRADILYRQTFMPITKNGDQYAQAVLATIGLGFSL